MKFWKFNMLLPARLLCFTALAAAVQKHEIDSPPDKNSIRNHLNENERIGW